MSELPTLPKKRSIRRVIFGLLNTVVLLGSAFFVAFVPSPYVIENPGPVYNVLGTYAGQPLLEIPGEKTYPTSGDLDLLTITIDGTPSRGVSWIQVGFSLLDQGKKLYLREEIFPPGSSDQQVAEEAEQMMVDSQMNSKAAALNELGIPVTTSVKVTSVTKTGAAWKILRAGDTLLRVDGDKATGIEQVRAAVAKTEGKRPLVLDISRNGKELTFEITPKKVDGKWRLGIFVQSISEFPFEIKISLDNVSGPSGGQIFALAIYDLLTPGQLTGGQKIAGTGTIDPDGTIGPIGGIQSKMYGAVRAGAKYFLAPSSNCDEVVGNIPDGLQVISVSKLDDSIAALEAISSGKAGSLPACTVEGK